MCHKGKNELISLGKNFSVKITEWNDKKGEVRSTNKNGLELRLKCINSLKIAQEVIDLNVYVINTLTSKQVAGLIKEGIKKPYNALKPKSPKDIMIQLNSNKTLKEWSEILINRKKKSEEMGYSRMV